MTIKHLICKSFAVIILVFSPTILKSQEIWENNKFSENKLRSLIGTVTPMIEWENRGESLIFHITDKDDIMKYYVVGNKGKATQLLYDAQKLIYEYNKLTNNKETEKTFKPRSITLLDKENKSFTFSIKNKFYKYDTDSNRLETYVPESKNTSKSESNEKISDSGRYELFGKGHNIYLLDRQTKKEKAITTDGQHYFSYNSVLKDIQKDKKTSTLARWIPKRNICYVLREDKRKVGELGYTKNTISGRPKHTKYKMEMPGDKYVTQYELSIFDADSAIYRKIDIGRYKDQKVKLSKAYSDAIYFTRLSRTLDTLELCRVNIEEKTVTTLIQEIIHPHINNVLQNHTFTDNGKYIIWWSERDGKGAYYRYDKNGKLINRITPKGIVAGRIFKQDKSRESIIYEAYSVNENEDPQYRHYFISKISGGKSVKLTHGEGYHNIEISPNGRYIVDEYSRVDLPPVMQLTEIDNPKNRNTFHCTDINVLIEYGWKPPVRIKLKAKDGKTDLYGIMYLPTNRVEGKRYPIISHVYPGPQVDQVPIRFDLEDSGNQDLAELGYVVINIAPRGSSPYRGKDFYCFSVGDMMRYPLEDDKYVIEQLAEKYYFIDINKVGIYGHSGGGFMTVSALLTYPDFYKVAVAASGNYDNNIYVRDWGELYQGVKKIYNEKTNEYEFVCVCPTPITMADRLKGKLLIISGDADKNVNVASTMRLVDAFIKSDKMIDMMILPDTDHWLPTKYYFKMVRKYFYENLK